jgi:SsrA-binding protein
MIQPVKALGQRGTHDERGEAGLVAAGEEDATKLLLHKTEIVKLGQKIKEGGYTLVPLKLYFTDGRAKVELALAKGKKDYDKRHALRERQDKREADRAISARRNLGD